MRKPWSCTFFMSSTQITPEQRVSTTFSNTARRMRRKSQSTSRSRRPNTVRTNQWYTRPITMRCSGSERPIL